jgi:hypothetical protein
MMTEPARGSQFLAALLACATVGAPAAPDRRPSWALWAWAAAAAGAAWLPGAGLVLPCLLVLKGPLALAPLGAAAVVALSRSGRLRWPGALDRPGPALAVAFAWLAGAGLWYVSGLRVSGDEPHYLLMAQSLWNEGDLDLRDNFDRQDYREYTPGPVAPHYGSPRGDGRPFPAHSPGLPLLLAPFYAIGGRRACALLLAACGALLAGQVRAVAERLGADPTGARLAWVASLGPPVFFYAFHVYTELPSALAIAIAVRLLTPRAPLRSALAAAVAIACLPWLHLKLLLVSAALAAVGAARLRGRALSAFGAVLAAAGGAFLSWYHYVFGRPSPFAIYGGMPPEFSEGSPVRALAGLLLDRSFGLLPFAPIAVLALPGCARLVRSADGRTLLLILGCLTGPALFWRMWWGGQCPPARFLVPAAVVTGTALALASTASAGRGLARWRGVLVAAGFSVALVAIARPGDLLLVNRGDRPTRFWAALSGERPVERYLPSLVFASAAETRVALVWLVALALLLALDALARRGGRDWFGTPVPALAFFLFVGVLVDVWARGP